MVKLTRCFRRPYYRSDYQWRPVVNVIVPDSPSYTVIIIYYIADAFIQGDLVRPRQRVNQFAGIETNNPKQVVDIVKEKVHTVSNQQSVITTGDKRLTYEDTRGIHRAWAGRLRRLPTRGTEPRTFG